MTSWKKGQLLPGKNSRMKELSSIFTPTQQGIKCMIHASSATVSYSSFVILISSDLCVHFVGLHGLWLIKLFGQFSSHIMDPLCKWTSVRTRFCFKWISTAELQTWRRKVNNRKLMLYSIELYETADCIHHNLLQHFPKWQKAHLSPVSLHWERIL